MAARIKPVELSLGAARRCVFKSYAWAQNEPLLGQRRQLTYENAGTSVRRDDQVSGAVEFQFPNSGSRSLKGLN